MASSALSVVLLMLLTGCVAQTVTGECEITRESRTTTVCKPDGKGTIILVPTPTP